MRTRLDLVGCKVSSIVEGARPIITFNDTLQSKLHLDGVFSLVEDSVKTTFEPPLKEWENAICLHFVERTVIRARFTSDGALFIDFDDNLSLHVEDGPFVNWRLLNASGESWHGGCGTVS